MSAQTYTWCQLNFFDLLSIIYIYAYSILVSLLRLYTSFEYQHKITDFKFIITNMRTNLDLHVLYGL